MARALDDLVRRRAGFACEYCKLRQVSSSIPFEIDHIRAGQYGGKRTLNNTCVACFYCNKFKGPNIAGFDPVTGKLTRLFNPRRHKWSWHFRWEGPVLVGRTPIGRTTVIVLAINQPDAIAHRQALIEEAGSPM